MRMLVQTSAFCNAAAGAPFETCFASSAFTRIVTRYFIDTSGLLCLRILFPLLFKKKCTPRRLIVQCRSTSTTGTECEVAAKQPSTATTIGELSANSLGLRALGEARHARAAGRRGCGACGAVAQLGPVDLQAMSAIFNFEALLLVLLLLICTATYLKDQPLVGPRMEANKYGCVLAGSLMLCSKRAAHEFPGTLTNSKSGRGCAPARALPAACKTRPSLGTRCGSCQE